MSVPRDAPPVLANKSHDRTKAIFWPGRVGVTALEVAPAGIVAEATATLLERLVQGAGRRGGERRASTVYRVAEYRELKAPGRPPDVWSFRRGARSPTAYPTGHPPGMRSAGTAPEGIRRSDRPELAALRGELILCSFDCG